MFTTCQHSGKEPNYFEKEIAYAMTVPPGTEVSRRNGGTKRPICAGEMTSGHAGSSSSNAGGWCDEREFNCPCSGTACALDVWSAATLAMDQHRPGRQSSNGPS